MRPLSLQANSKLCGIAKKLTRTRNTLRNKAQSTPGTKQTPIPPRSSRGGISRYLDEKTMGTEQFDPFAAYLREQDRSENTVSGYLADLTHFTRWHELTNGEKLTMENVTPIDVREYRDTMMRHKLSPNTANRRLASLSAYFRFGMETEQIAADPTAKIRPVKQIASSVRWLDRKQRFALQRIIEQACQLSALHHYPRRSLWQLRDAMLVTVMLHTGVRVAEVANLDQSDVDLKPRSGTIHVRGKGNKHRDVPLNAEARDALQKWLAVRPNPDTPAVFVSQFMRRMTTRTIERVISEYGTKAKLAPLTPHMLRHTFAKTLVDRGVPIDQVATLLGHSNLNTTRIYTQPSQQDLERAVATLVDE